MKENQEVNWTRSSSKLKESDQGGRLVGRSLEKRIEFVRVSCADDWTIAKRIFIIEVKLREIKKQPESHLLATFAVSFFFSFCTRRNELEFASYLVAFIG